MKRRPAVTAVICLMSGIAACRMLPVDPGAYLLAGIACLLGGAILIQFGRISSFCLAIALTACGAALGQTEVFYYPADEIGRFASQAPTLAELELIVEQPPQRYASKRFSKTDRQQLRCRVSQVRTWKGWRPATGQVTAWVGQADPQLDTGSRFRAMGWLSRAQPAMNPGQFDWGAYARRQRALTTFSIRGPGQIVIVGHERPTAIQWLRARARQLLDLGFADGPSHDLLRALLLGDHPPELTSIREDFRRTGTAHHLSTSGMHVAVVALLVYFLCRLLCQPPRRSAILALGILLLYGLVVTPSPPIVRSILLAGAIGGGILLGRRTDALQLLALAMLAMLIDRPLDLFSAGFQLSFAAVASLMLFSKPLGELLIVRRNEALPILTPRHGRRAALGRWTRRQAVGITATGLAAWLICAPLIAWHFRQFNPFAIAAGAILEPVVSLSIIGGAVKIVLTLLMPFWASAWAALAAMPASWLLYGVNRLALVPGMDLMTVSPPVWLLVGWYGGMLLLLTWWRGAGRLKQTATFCVFLLGCLFLLGGGSNLRAGEARLTVLSIGAGQCAVLEMPGGHAVLFDAGSQAFDAMTPQVLDPFFRLRGIRQIDSIFISHPNRDHFSAVAEVVRRFGAGRIYVARQFVEESAHNLSAARLLDQLEAMDRAPVRIASGRHIFLNEETAVDVLWPDDTTRLHDNEASLVLRVRHGGRSILLSGDIQSRSQRRLLARPERLRSDVLIAPHHGSSESTTAHFVQAVDPIAIISSDDGSYTQKQRNFERLIENRPLYRTGRCGAVTVHLDKNGRLTLHSFSTDAALSRPLTLSADREIHGANR